jgi:hypothetical protein
MPVKMGFHKGGIKSPDLVQGFIGFAGRDHKDMDLSEYLLQTFLYFSGIQRLYIRVRDDTGFSALYIHLLHFLYQALKILLKNDIIAGLVQVFYFQTSCHKEFLSEKRTSQIYGKSS